MQALKVIAAIDIMRGQAVRLRRGDPGQATVYGEDPSAFARRWQDEGADMLHIVDLDAALGRGSNADAISNIARAASVPVEVAGGLRSEAAALEAARHADRIVVGTLAMRDRAVLEAVARAAGRERVVISVDHRAGTIAVDGWQASSHTRLSEGVASFARAGFTEFLLTDVERDGMMSGPETGLLRESCSVRGIRVISSGGISGPQDIAPVRDAGAYGVILGRALYEGAITIAQAGEIARR